MGLGLYEQGSGGMAAQFFAKHGAKVLVTDLRIREQLKSALARLKKYKNIEYVLGRHREEDFQKADLIFQNPSVPAHSLYLEIARKAKIPIVNDWSIFLSMHQPKLFIGVTGTRGKSTTTQLIYEMLTRHHSHIRTNVRMTRKGSEVFLAGNLGVSPLAFIDTYKGESIVAELSSWLLHHFPAARISPNIAVVTNIMNDHMDKYRTQREYIADKENIFKFQKNNGVVVLNYDSQITRSMAKQARGRVVWFSLKKHLPKWVPLNQVALLGEHNLQNALAAAAAAEAAGVSRKDILQVLKTFRGLPNRLELVREIKGVRYYNDTTATTPDATIAALKTLGASSQELEARGKKIILICGGADKKLEYKELARHIKQYCKAVILLPGTATDKIRFQISDFSIRAVGSTSRKGRFQILNANSILEAVKNASGLAKRADIILLSPGAASFGLFKNEFDRGERFVKEVKRLK